MRNKFSSNLLQKGLISFAAASVLATGVYAGLAEFDARLTYQDGNYAVTGDVSKGVILTITALDENGNPATTYSNGTLIRGNENLITITSSLVGATKSANVDYNQTMYGFESNLSFANSVADTTNYKNYMATMPSTGIVRLTKGADDEISADGRIRFFMNYGDLIGYGEETITIASADGISKSVPVTIQPNKAEIYIVRADSSIDIDPSIDNNRILSDLQSTNRDLNKPIPHNIKGVKTAGDSVTVTVLAVDDNTSKTFTAYTPDTTKTIYALYRDTTGTSITYTVLDKQEANIVDGQAKVTFTITKGDDNRSLSSSTVGVNEGFEAGQDGGANIIFTANYSACGTTNIGDDVTDYFTLDTTQDLILLISQNL